MDQWLRPTWAEINLDHLAHNVATIKEGLNPGCEIMAVVKANAYGHGAVEVTRAALAAGANWVAVSILDEACELRRAGIQAPILVMGYTPAEQGGVAASQNISLTVFDEAQATALAQAALATAAVLKLHLKVDTGMGRLGVSPQEVIPLATALQRLPGCQLEGIFTHFAQADAADLAVTRQQLQRFQAALQQLEQAGITVPLVHAANSAAALRLPPSQFNAVRLGLAMYGLYPSEECRGGGALRPVMSLKTRVAQVKRVPAATPISYGARFVTARPSQIITLPLGYADGLSRALSNRGSVLVRGSRVPLVGTICMDQCLADATHLPRVDVGDEVLVWGETQEQALPLDELAVALGTISYELLTLVNRRVPRVYLRQGQEVGRQTLLE